MRWKRERIKDHAGGILIRIFETDGELLIFRFDAQRKIFQRPASEVFGLRLNEIGHSFVSQHCDWIYLHRAPGRQVTRHQRYARKKQRDRCESDWVGGAHPVKHI
jgi:hypothetical protein